MSVAETRWGSPALRQPARRRPAARPSPEPSRAPLRVLDSSSRSRPRLAQRPRLVLVGGLGVICLVLLGVVAAHVMLAQSQLRLDRLNHQLANQVQVHQRLELQAAQLESPTRIMTTAQQRLHMVAPASVTYLSPKARTAHPARTGSTAGAGRTGSTAGVGRTGTTGPSGR